MSTDYGVIGPIIQSLQSTLPSKLGDSFNILQTAEIVAGFESASYYIGKMRQAEAVQSGLELLSHAVAWKQIDGLVMEFGVASGRTINHIGELLPNSTIYGFDSFDGLPETWRTGYGAGAFAQSLPATRPNVELVQGLFGDTLRGFLEAHGGDVALLHVDCDLYSSAKLIFTELNSRILPGTVIVFDEYINYPGWQNDEFKAFQEFVDSTSARYEYLGFVPSHQQVCVRILSRET